MADKFIPTWSYNTAVPKDRRLFLFLGKEEAFFLSDKHKAARLKWAKEHEGWPLDD